MTLQLPYNPIPVFYSGGQGICEYRGIDSDHGLLSPEDWIGSTTSTLSGATDADGAPVGFSRVADGRTVAQVITDDPGSWLGSGAGSQDVDYLLKLLNPSVRIPVHWHPDATYARRHLGVDNGKAEAWIVLSDTATVWLGFNEGTTLPDIKTAISEQDSEWMLSRMHRVELSRDDTVFVPPGLVHAIGAGALLAEIQEPSSASILAEHAALGLSADRASLSIGWDAALECLAEASSRNEILELVGRVPDVPGQFPLLTPRSREFFQAAAVNVSGRCSVRVDRLSAALVDRGPLTWVQQSTGQHITASSGSTWLLAGGLNLWDIEGDGRVLVFSGPR